MQSGVYTEKGFYLKSYTSIQIAKCAQSCQNEIKRVKEVRSEIRNRESRKEAMKHPNYSRCLGRLWGIYAIVLLPAFSTLQMGNPGLKIPLVMNYISPL
jgi:hypothetical protein